MKVLFITNDFPPKVGGGASYASTLALGLLQVGVDIQVVTTAGKRGFEPVPQVPIRRITPIMDIKGLKVLPLMVATLWACLKGRPHRLLAMSWTHDGVAAFLVSRMLGIPYVVHAHGTEILRHRQGPLRPLMLTVLRAAQTVVANSTFTKGIIESLGIPPQRVAVVNPPVIMPTLTLSQNDKAVDDRFGLHGKRVILTVARLVKRKGHALVLQALHDLREHYPDLVYVITGDGDYRSQLERTAQEYGIADMVRFTGFLPKEEVWQLYQRADIYISPSLDDQGDVEGFGISFVEASLCGKPVIAGRSGGVADVVLDRETGILVDARNPDEVTRALQTLLDNPALREHLGKAARERALKEFTPEAQAQKMLAALEGVEKALSRDNAPRR